MPYRVENKERKGEIACYKQFPLFSQCFHSYISLVQQNAALCGNGIKGNIMRCRVNQTYRVLATQRKKPINENIQRKVKIMVITSIKFFSFLNSVKKCFPQCLKISKIYFNLHNRKFYFVKFNFMKLTKKLKLYWLGLSLLNPFPNNKF